ncbi:MAG: twin-arginine translocation signal domain-containing protein, partial [Bacillota bacterium]
MTNTYYHALLRKGYTRRDFLRLCTILTATMGLDASFISQVAHAL